MQISNFSEINILHKIFSDYIGRNLLFFNYFVTEIKMF